MKRAVYFIYGCLTIFATLGASSVHAQIPSYAESIRQQTNSILDLHTTHTLDELSGAQAETFSIPNRWHTKGILHSAIYRTTVNGQPTLIKTIFPDSNGYSNDSSFRREVFAMLLASGIGGPRIYRAGKITNEQGAIGYFIQMEEMFPGERDTFTFKGWGSKTLLERGLSWRSPSPKQLSQIGQMINMALERGIAIDIDHDFIFSSRSDNVRWLDTAQWQLAEIGSIDQPIYEVLDYSRNELRSELALNNYGYLLTLFFRLKKDYGMSVLESLLSSIQSSRVWSESQKKQLVENLRTTLVRDWKTPSDLFETAAQKSRKTGASGNRCADIFRNY